MPMMIVSSRHHHQPLSKSDLLQAEAPSVKKRLFGISPCRPPCFASKQIVATCASNDGTAQIVGKSCLARSEIADMSRVIQVFAKESAFTEGHRICLLSDQIITERINAADL